MRALRARCRLGCEHSTCGGSQNAHNVSDESLSHTTVVDPIDKWAFVGTVVMFGLTATFMGSDFPAFVYLVLTVLVIHQGDLLAKQSNQGRWTAATAIGFFIIGSLIAAS